MPEAVDGLELVPHREDLGEVGMCHEVDQLALQAVRVLELVDHDHAKAQLRRLADLGVVTEQVARGELEILEVDRRLAPLRGGVLGREALEQLLQQVAVVRGELLERGPLGRLARRLERRGANAACRERAEIDELLRKGARGCDPQRLAGVASLGIRRGRIALEQLCLGAKTREGVVDARTLAELEHERSTRGAERLVDAREHPPQAVCAVGREQSEPLGLFAGAERFERTRERLAAQHHRACIHELPEARVEAGRERMRAQKPVAEAVNRGDPRRVELTGEVGPPALAQRGSDARAELTRSLPRVGDDQDRVHVDAALADGTHVALDEHRRLAGAGASRDEHRPLRLDRSELVIVE